jgi:hypothetical protein
MVLACGERGPSLGRVRAMVATRADGRQRHPPRQSAGALRIGDQDHPQPDPESGRVEARPTWPENGSAARVELGDHSRGGRHRGRFPRSLAADRRPARVPVASALASHHFAWRCASAAVGLAARLATAYRLESRRDAPELGWQVAHLDHWVPPRSHPAHAATGRLRRRFAEAAHADLPANAVGNSVPGVVVFVKEYLREPSPTERGSSTGGASPSSLYITSSFCLSQLVASQE